MSDHPTPSFNNESHMRIQELIDHYPQKDAALIPVLHVAQEQFGYLSNPVIELVAKTLEITAAHVYGTASFYDMFRFAPPAKHQVLVCRNISCYLCGCETLKQALSDKLHAPVGGTSPDGRYSLHEVECLAACDAAPVMMVDGRLYRNVDDKKLAEVLKSYV